MGNLNTSMVFKEGPTLDVEVPELPLVGDVVEGETHEILCILGLPEVGGEANKALMGKLLTEEVVQVLLDVLVDEHDDITGVGEPRLDLGLRVEGMDEPFKGRKLNQIEGKVGSSQEQANLDVDHLLEIRPRSVLSWGIRSLQELVNGSCLESASSILVLAGNSFLLQLLVDIFKCLTELVLGDLFLNLNNENYGLKLRSNKTD